MPLPGRLNGGSPRQTPATIRQLPRRAVSPSHPGRAGTTQPQKREKRKGSQEWALPRVTRIVPVANAERTAHPDHSRIGRSPLRSRLRDQHFAALCVLRAFAVLTFAVQCGNGHSRSFSLAICQSRASPCGSTARKKMISAPKIISSRFEVMPGGRSMPSAWASGSA